MHSKDTSNCKGVENMVGLLSTWRNADEINENSGQFISTKVSAAQCGQPAEAFSQLTETFVTLTHDILARYYEARV